jgi:hypothetical protein
MLCDESGFFFLGEDHRGGLLGLSLQHSGGDVAFCASGVGGRLPHHRERAGGRRRLGRDRHFDTALHFRSHLLENNFVSSY